MTIEWRDWQELDFQMASNLDESKLNIRHECLHSIIANSSAISNTAAKTAFSTAYTLPASKLNKVGQELIISGKGIYSTIGTPTAIITVRIGGTDIFTSETYTLKNNASGDSFCFECRVIMRKTGATGTVEKSGGWCVFSGVTMRGDATAVGTVSKDFTTTQAIDVTIQFSAADAANTATLTCFNVEWDNPGYDLTIQDNDIGRHHLILERAAAQTGIVTATPTKITGLSVVVDGDGNPYNSTGAFDAAVSDSLFRWPLRTACEITCTLKWENGTDDTRRRIYLLRNEVEEIGLSDRGFPGISGQDRWQNGSVSVLINPGDKFELYVLHAKGSNTEVSDVLLAIVEQLVI